MKIKIFNGYSYSNQYSLSFEEAEEHIKVAKEQGKNIMGNVISNFEIREVKE